MLGSVGALLKGLAVGAGAMYYADPTRGRRRRARMVDRGNAVLHELEDLWVSGCRDLQNRSLGLAAEARRLVDFSPADDQLLVARVRSAMGHLIEDASVVQVAVLNGVVTLRGTVHPGELERLIPALERVVGVRGVTSSLRTAGEPVTQVATCPVHGLPPAARLLMTAGGGVMMLTCLTRRGFGSGLLGTAGFGLFARGLVDRPGRLTGLSTRRQGIDIRKSIHIAAPVEKVFDFIADVEQSKRFLPNVTDVEELGDGRTRWTLASPLGEMTFEERVTESVENERLHWESWADSPVSYVGETRFTPDGDGTRVDVRLSYRPPGGVFGHAAAAFFGVDPKTQLDESLNRIKMYLEEGTVAHDVTAASTEQR